MDDAVGQEVMVLQLFPPHTCIFLKLPAGIIECMTDRNKYVFVTVVLGMLAVHHDLFVRHS